MCVPAAGIIQVISPLYNHVFYTEPPVEVLIQELAQVLTLSVGFLEK